MTNSSVYPKIQQFQYVLRMKLRGVSLPDRKCGKGPMKVTCGTAGFRKLRKHKWDEEIGIGKLSLPPPSSYLTVWENPDSDKKQTIDYFGTQISALILLPFMPPGKLIAERSCYLSQDPSLQLQSYCWFSWMQFPFTFITEKYWPWVFWTYIYKADDADRMNHTRLHFHFIHISFELGLFYTSYPEFRPWKIELLVEL